jgi:uncharacterized protein (DUF1697 family)
MPVLISMLRGVNLGSHNKINMGALRALYEALKFEDPRTYVQSGNVIFRSKEKISPALANIHQRQLLQRRHRCQFRTAVNRCSVQVQVRDCGVPCQEAERVHLQPSKRQSRQLHTANRI